MPASTRAPTPRSTKSPEIIAGHGAAPAAHEPVDSDFDAFDAYDQCTIATASGTRLDLGSLASLVDGRFHE